MSRYSGDFASTTQRESNLEWPRALTNGGQGGGGRQPGIGRDETWSTRGARVRRTASSRAEPSGRAQLRAPDRDGDRRRAGARARAARWRSPGVPSRRSSRRRAGPSASSSHASKEREPHFSPSALRARDERLRREGITTVVPGARAHDSRDSLAKTAVCVHRGARCVIRGDIPIRLRRRGVEAGPRADLETGVRLLRRAHARAQREAERDREGRRGRRGSSRWRTCSRTCGPRFSRTRGRGKLAHRARENRPVRAQPL